ncbi:MAG: alkaline phosphatase [Planctomycetota bacterium]
MPLAAVLASLLTGVGIHAQDPLRDLQAEAIESMDEKRERLFSFGWQGLNGIFSTHRNHSNRLIPLVTFGPFSDLSALSGPNAAYRSEDRLAEIYGRTPPSTQTAGHEALDQTDIHRLIRSAVDQGCKRVIVMLLDGGDWHIQSAASVVAYDTYDPEGLGAGLPWFEYSPPGGVPGRPVRDEGFVVTSPLRGRVAPGYDIARGGRFPWSEQNAEYLAGDYYRDLQGRRTANRTVHAVVDSAASATAIFSGRKTTNGKINQGPDGERFVPLGVELQQRGFTVATVTDVPFDHASPACVYASEESRNSYQSIGRQMLGGGEEPGVDIVLGYGFGFGEDGQKYLSQPDLDLTRRFYNVVTPNFDAVPGEFALGSNLLHNAALRTAAERSGARHGPGRLFGFFGRAGLDHAPYRTADNRFDPVPGVNGRGAPGGPEEYSELDLEIQPTLREMTSAATKILHATPDAPFFLFVEAGLVDWAQHANNLDNAVGEVRSAAATFEHLADWVTDHGWWDETLFIVTSDHGHLLQVDFEGLREAVHGER